jgi:hypothetical protein
MSDDLTHGDPVDPVSVSGVLAGGVPPATYNVSGLEVVGGVPLESVRGQQYQAVIGGLIPEVNSEVNESDMVAPCELPELSVFDTDVEISE